ncbi:FAD binding domain-containing protein [Ktedonosporobacter rubrisoli]|nr:FAD binding domain-containing protein [Ktedonosporobacter rubrisoli]
MKPPVFAYYAPTDVDAALGMLQEFAREQKHDVKLLAGGQSLMPLLNMRLAHPEIIIDLNQLSTQLSSLRLEDDCLRIGALTRHYQLALQPLIVKHCPLLVEAVKLIGHAAIITRGTIGGSLVHADPAAELPLVLTTLGGSVTLASLEKRRELKVSEFFLSFLTTGIEDNELLIEVTVPVLPPGSGQAIEEFSLRHGDFALVAAAAQVTLGTDGTLAAVRLGIGGAAPTPIDCSHLFVPVLKQAPDPSVLREILHNVKDHLDPTADIHASAEYRLELAETLAYRALERAMQKAKVAIAIDSLH